MARRSISDWIRRKSRGRKAMTSGMRDLIDSNSFDANQPEGRPADPAPAETGGSASDASDRPSQAAQSA
jgi:hypothetical protein